MLFVKWRLQRAALKFPSRHDFFTIIPALNRICKCEKHQAYMCKLSMSRGTYNDYFLFKNPERTGILFNRMMSAGQRASNRAK
jgi:hypothetical protein